MPHFALLQPDESKGIGLTNVELACRPRSLRRDMEESRLNATARACANAASANDDAIRSLGMELVCVGPGYALVNMTVTEAMLNSYELCQGALTFALGDRAYAVTCNTFNKPAVAHRAVTFLDLARGGDQLVARAPEPTRADRSGIYVTVTREGVPLIAELRGHSPGIGAAILGQNVGQISLERARATRQMRWIATRAGVWAKAAS
jgi:acyl-CoA thioesterase